MTNETMVLVDNQRALRAFEKGVRELAAMWPELEAFYAELDRAAYENYDATRKQERDKYKAAMSEWERTKSRSWRKSSGSPPSSIDYFKSMYAYPCSRMNGPRDRRDSVKTLRDVACAAVGPYYLSRQEAQMMVGYEDGSILEEVRKNMESEKARREKRAAT